MAIETGLEETLASADAAMAALGQIIHGTTLVTNALIERKGASTALLASEGFRDSLEIGREHRYDLYDLQLEMPRPLVPRELRFGVPGRTLADGSTLAGHDLDEEYVERLARELAAAGIEAVAIAFLNSFANPELERRAREAVRRAAPDIRVSISSDVAPEIREYERTSTTVANVYVQARVERYLRDLEERLARAGFGGALLMLISSGALATVETAARFPVRLLESGPAGGALAAAAFGAAAGYEDLLSFDMGGTTAKFAVIARGEPLLAHGFEVDRRYRFKKGSGLPINLPVIEMIEIGAGGGSIARIDSARLLKVGPDSAGADPGPACYGRGGERADRHRCRSRPRLPRPGFFLGGAMSLDLDGGAGGHPPRRRRTSGAERRGGRLGYPPDRQRGDGRRGAGAHIGAGRRSAPAAGLRLRRRGPRAWLSHRGGARLAAPDRPLRRGGDERHRLSCRADRLRFHPLLPRPPRRPRLGARQRAHRPRWKQKAATCWPRLVCAVATVTQRRAAEMRYVGQGHEVRVPLPPGPLTPASVPALREAFETEYLRLYGRLGPPVAVEAITWRVVSSGPRPDLRLSTAPEATGDAESARKGTRRAFVPEQGGMTDVWSTIATGWDRARRSLDPPSSRSVNRRPSSVPGRRCRLMIKVISLWGSPTPRCHAEQSEASRMNISDARRNNEILRLRSQNDTFLCVARLGVTHDVRCSRAEREATDDA